MWPWIPNAEMAKHLSISERTLFRCRAQGLLQEGRHFVRKNPLHRSGPILWNAKKVEEALGRSR
tara:strand:+ start:42020 stop:42211 length:192 start_codon:yes stop_codon:yes gene_type:complete